MDTPASPSTVGQQLRQAREARKLSLDQAAGATHIRRHYLEALEAGEYGSLPSTAQARGFLRSYALYLKLDPEALVSLINGGQGAAPAAEPETAQPSAVPLPSGEAEIIFADIGSRLRQQRELLGISLDDVERHTYLRLNNLKALEQGRLQSLPSPVQARGMLSNYATFLGMDPEPLLLRFAEGLQAGLYARQAARPERKQPATQALRQPGPLRRLISADLLIGSLLIIFLVVFLSWGALRISSVRSSQTATATSPSIADVLTHPTATTTLPGEIPLISGTATVEGTPGLEMQPTAAEQTPVPGENEAQPTITPTVFTVSSGSAVQINIVARQRAWMRVLVDGEVGFSGRVAPGSAYVFSGSDRVEVTTGNGAALQVFFNQQDIGYLGILGEVVNRVFTAQGAQTPTPAPTQPGQAKPTPTLPSGLVFPTPAAP